MRTSLKHKNIKQMLIDDLTDEQLLEERELAEKHIADCLKGDFGWMRKVRPGFGVVNILDQLAENELLPADCVDALITAIFCRLEVTTFGSNVIENHTVHPPIEFFSYEDQVINFKYESLTKFIFENLREGNAAICFMEALSEQCAELYERLIANDITPIAVDEIADLKIAVDFMQGEMSKHVTITQDAMDALVTLVQTGKLTVATLLPNMPRATAYIFAMRKVTH